jgi:hypothetical protein
MWPHAIVFNDNEVVSQPLKVDIVTDLIKTLPGNGSVYTFQHATIQGELCFLCGLLPCNGTTFSSV